MDLHRCGGFDFVDHPGAVMFGKMWWGKTLERMARATSYTLITLIGTDQMGWAHLDWIFIGRTGGIVALLSFLGCITTTKLGTDGEDPGVL